MIGIGIDTGGTCTDAVAFDMVEGRILASAKSQTTHDHLEIGIGSSLDKLPEELLHQASFLALSTTLATNACVENKGGKVFMIFIGVSEKVVRYSYREYGFESLDDILFVEGNAKEHTEPGWDLFEMEITERLSAYDSVAIAQMNAEENDGAYEQKAAELIRKQSTIPVVCAYHLFHDRNVIQRGASALLNARLLPVIDEFLEAVRCSMRLRNLNCPVVIMRSDGSLMNETYARNHPVETLLCGPAASVMGGAYLGHYPKSVIIDMGGTTSDIALVKENLPVRAENGIQIGSWRTFVKGLYVDTFGLGGDSEICYHESELFLSDRRVMPLCILAAQYPDIFRVLDNLDEDYWKGHSKPMYSFYIKQKDIVGNPRYTEEEQMLVKLLEHGPLSLAETAHALHTDVYRLNLQRLEDEGIILRSGLTPTDMMCIRGDFTLYDAKASRLAAAFLAKSTHHTEAEIPSLVYELVEKKLYKNIVRILLEDRFRRNKSYVYTDEIDLLVEDCFQLSKSKLSQKGEEGSNHLIQTLFQSDAVLVGVGAPIHVFLPEVAKLLGTTCFIPPEAGVTNALGAVIGDIRAEVVIQIKANYEMNSEEEAKSGYYVYGVKEPQIFEKYEEALAYAKENGEAAARKKALERGAVEISNVLFREEQQNAMAYGMNLFLGSEVHVEAVGKMGFTA